MTKEHLPEQHSAASRKHRPYVLVAGLIGGLVSIGILVILLVQSLEIAVEPGSIGEPGSQNRPSPSATDEISRSSEAVETSSESLSPDSSAPSRSPTQTSNRAIAPQTSSVDQPGDLRVSNQTLHPVRVALLFQAGDWATGDDLDDSANSLAAASASLIYGEPVHWDFAPGEGAAKGLVLALPDRELQVRQGDVLAVFAQDGSQRYWGPYVVGSTAFPTWNGEASEWQLILGPDSDSDSD